MEADFNNVIEMFRAGEKAKVIRFVAHDEEAQLLVSAWSPDLIEYVPDGTAPPENLNDQWDWLWLQVAIDLDTLIERAGIIHFIPKFNIAKNTKMIYPDGTIHEQVEKFLKNQADAAIEDTSPKKKRAYKSR